jgi:hypothetical protein
MTSGVGFAIASAFANVVCNLTLLVDLHDLSKPYHGLLMLGLVDLDLPRLWSGRDVRCRLQLGFLKEGGEAFLAWSL